MGGPEAGQGRPVAEAADSLYDLPLDEFTRARDELARELRRSGDRAGADEVRALPKPTAAAWAVNQLARRRRSKLEELLRAGAALREAQQRVLAGEGAELLADAGGKERTAVDRLVRLAGELVAEGGGRASAATLERVAETLHAAASDDELRDELERGRVLRERKAAMFAGLAPATGGGKRATPKRAPAKRAPAKRTPAKRTPAKQADTRRARAEERKRRELVQRGKAELRELRAAQRDAERAVAKAERELERTHATLRDAEQAVRDAERRLAELDGSG